MRTSRFPRFTALLLISALLSNHLALAAKKPADPAVMKARIQRRGVGQGVRVTLADNSEVKGMILTVGEESFSVKPKHAAQPQEIEYSKVAGVHNDKLTRGQKVAITVGVVGAAIAVTGILFNIKFDKSVSKCWLCASTASQP